MTDLSSRAVMERRAPRQVEADDPQRALWRKLDYFPTPPWAARAIAELILEIDPAAQSIWEPACGQGHMAEPFREYFDPAKVLASDIYDHGYGAVIDFLSPHRLDLVADWIFTNPPFTKAKEFVERMLERADRGCGVLVRLAFLESADRYDLIYGDIGVERTVAVFADRVPMQLGSWDPELSTASAYCCVLWNKRGDPKKPTTLRAFSPARAIAFSGRATCGGSQSSRRRRCSMNPRSSCRGGRHDDRADGQGDPRGRGARHRRADGPDRDADGGRAMSEPKRYLYSLEEIKQRLQGRALDLAHVLLPGGSLIGPHWVALNPRRKDTRPGPLVNVRKGVWKDFAGGDKDAGDMLHFVATFATNGDYKKAVPWAKDFLGLTGRAPDPAECARIEAEAKKAREDEERAALKRRRAAQALMHEATPLCGDDPASLYLKARGIDVTKLAQGIPRALRFHPTCMAFPENYPSAAMLAFISREDLPHGFAAVHRTYLENYLGTWRKRRFPDRDGKPMNSKRVLGQYAGGSIRLTKGESKKALKDAPAGEWLTTAEGIENALSVAMAQPKMRVLAHVSGSNLAHLALPEQLGGVYVVQDNDAPNSKAAQQFAKAVETLAQRYELAIVSMDGEYKDANDALLGKRRSA